MAALNQISSNNIWIVCLRNTIILNALLFGVITATIQAEVIFEAAFQGIFFIFSNFLPLIAAKDKLDFKFIKTGIKFCFYK
jgi:hypothetical protein